MDINIKKILRLIKWDIVIYVLVMAGTIAYLHLVEPPEDDFLGFGHLLEGMVIIILATFVEFFINLGYLIWKDRKSVFRWLLLAVMLVYLMDYIYSVHITAP